MSATLAALALLISQTRGMKFCPTPGVAKVLARQSGRIIVALVQQDDMFGSRLRAVLDEQDVQKALGNCVTVIAPDMPAVRALLPKPPPASRSHLVFLDPQGTVLKRMATFMRTDDIARALSFATWARGREPLLLRSKPTPSALADLAALYAGRGELDRSRRVLARATAAKAPPDGIAFVHEQIAEELRVRGDREGAIASLINGLQYARSDDAVFRLRIRVGMTMLMLGRVAEAQRHANLAVMAAHGPDDLAFAKRLLERTRDVGMERVPK